MGTVTEAQFAAMHHLADNPPAQLFGKDVIIGGARGYLSIPPGVTAPMPAVLVVHEWWGLNDNIRHYADRLASIGVAALAVDLYGGNVATTPDQASAYMKSVDPAVAIKVLKAGADYLKDEPTIKATKRGAIGFCFGG
ncbi:MAG: dienelactone hydrolase family protein, partial [Clostridia bacterium]|nr:dienelactone hydrolase family protein [Deltaproteobacteria bacterium]